MRINFSGDGKVIPLNWVLYQKKIKFEFNKNTLVVPQLFGIVF